MMTKRSYRCRKRFLTPLSDGGPYPESLLALGPGSASAPTVGSAAVAHGRRLPTGPCTGPCGAVTRPGQLRPGREGLAKRLRRRPRSTGRALAAHSWNRAGADWGTGAAGGTSLLCARGNQHTAPGDYGASRPGILQGSPNAVYYAGGAR